MRVALPSSLALLALSVSGLAGCAVYDAPPEPSIDGLNNGYLPNARDPIVIDFSKPPVQSTVDLQIIQLGANDSCFSIRMPENVLFSHDPVNGDMGGVATWSSDGTSLSVALTIPPPIAATLAVLVSPGLSDQAGTVTHAQRCLSFGYQATLSCNAAAKVVTSGTYFLLVSVTNPVPVQIKLFGAIDVDDTTGALKGAFTEAHRNPDPTRCTPACSTTDACRTLPGPPACVTPSTPAGSVDEFPDFLPNTDPTTGGFSFDVTGCTVDQDATTATFATVPTDVDITSPTVTLRNAGLSASFTSTDGVLRGTGALAADDVLLGTTGFGAGQGDLTARDIPAGQVPPNVPQPP
jgi:hypothetical protein